MIQTPPHTPPSQHNRLANSTSFQHHFGEDTVSRRQSQQAGHHSLSVNVAEACEDWSGECEEGENSTTTAGSMGDSSAESHHRSYSLPPSISAGSSATMYSGQRHHLSPLRSCQTLVDEDPYKDVDLDKGEKSKGQQLSMSSSEKRYFPPPLLLSSVLGILTCTAGMASMMVLWIYSHKLPLQSFGVVYLHEGDEDELARVYTDKTIGPGARLRFNELSSHPTTLSLSSIIVFLIGWSLYPMMGLIAYGLASDWIKLQERVASATPSHLGAMGQLPSPLQYALLTRICSSNSISSILDTIRHWRTLRREGRGGVPAILKKGLAWLVVLLSLQTSIAWLDFFLHETTRTVSVVDVDSKTDERPYSMAINQTLCPSSTEPTSLPCLLDSPDASNAGSNQAATFAADYPTIGSVGWLVANKASHDYAVQIHNDADDDRHNNLAFYSNPNIRTQDYMESGHTIGLRAKCKMLTDECHASNDSFDCADVGRPELENAQLVVQDHSASARDYLTISNVIYSTNASGDAQLGADAMQGAQSNPWKVSGLIVYPFAPYLNHSGFQDVTVNMIDSPQSPHSYGAFECDLAFRDVQVSYFNQSFEVQSSKLSDVGVAHTLSGPLLAKLVTNVAFSAVASVAGRENGTSFSQSLEKSLAYNVLALSAGLISQQPIPIRSWVPILAQQYNLAILLGYIALLYAYALTAIVLFFWAWGISSTCVVYRDGQGNVKEVPAVFLAQSRLMEPASHLIANHLTSKGDGPGQRVSSDHGSASRTAQTGLLDIFGNFDHQQRIVVGLEGSGRGFGVWPMPHAHSAATRPFAKPKQRDPIEHYPLE